MNTAFIKRFGHSLSHYAIALLFTGSTVSFAAPRVLELDKFDAPAPLATRVVWGVPGSPEASVKLSESGLPVPGGARDTALNMYGNPLGSIAALAVGDGKVSTTQGTGVTAETIVSYGAFTRVGGHPLIGGPRLGLDLTGFNSLEVEFAGAEDNVNVNVTYYTAKPLDQNKPLYYSSAGVNSNPATTGAPLVVTLPADNNPLFNWRSVDGIVVLINRSGPTPATSYTLDTLRLVQ